MAANYVCIKLEKLVCNKSKQAMRMRLRTLVEDLKTLKYALASLIPFSKLIRALIRNVN